VCSPDDDDDVVDDGLLYCANYFMLIMSELIVIWFKPTVENDIILEVSFVREININKVISDQLASVKRHGEYFCFNQFLGC
jgi:hypothetical protein